MTPIQKPSPLHILEIVASTHQVRTYLEQIDKYVAYLEWLVKEREGVIAELRDDLYGGGVTDAVPITTVKLDGAEITTVSVNDTDNETMAILTQCANEIRAECAESAAIAEKANQDYMNAPVPASDYVKMTETEQEEVTAVKTPEAGHSVTPLQIVQKRRGCPPGGWPKKDPSEVIAKAPKVKKTVDLDAPKKVRSNLRPYELLRSNDLLQVVGFIEKFGTRRLGMPEVADMALYLRIERDLMVTLLKKYGKLHSAGTAIPLILSMHAKNKGKPYPLEELSKISQGFPSVHFPKIPSTQEQISVQ